MGAKLEEGDQVEVEGRVVEKSTKQKTFTQPLINLQELFAPPIEVQNQTI